jgi:hypothetical protein
MRVQQAANLLGFERVEIVNLLDVPTATVLDHSVAGREPAPWLSSRRLIVEGLDRTNAVLVGWGCVEPQGPARQHHRSQVAWLRDALSQAGSAIWTVGGSPRHPSRWQRYTSRAFPGVPFPTALARSLTTVDIPATAA